MHPALIIAAAAAKDPPLIDIDSTVFLQLVIFLVTLGVLSKFLFKPYLQVRSAREKGIDGAKDEARRMEQDAAQRIAEYETALTKAKTKANDERTKLRLEAAEREREMTEAARAKTQSALEEARKTLASEQAAARAELEPHADQIAHTIAKKILGREVA
jgi:F-type H+-transporting ATPase subunit b